MISSNDTKHVRTSRASVARPTVFVVDDDISMRESLELLIQSAGWQPETFASAREFLAHPQTLIPSCLILDVTLPDLNGLDVQKRAAVDRPEMPIIFITGHGDIPTSVQAMKAGAIEFLTKPFNSDVLLDGSPRCTRTEPLYVGTRSKDGRAPSELRVAHAARA
jgi:FixJ family two-component response regulator